MFIPPLSAFWACGLFCFDFVYLFGFVTLILFLYVIRLTWPSLAYFLIVHFCLLLLSFSPVAFVFISNVSVMFFTLPFIWAMRPVSILLASFALLFSCQLNLCSLSDYRGWVCHSLGLTCCYFCFSFPSCLFMAGRRVVIEGQNYLRYCRVSVELGRGKSLICITVESMRWPIVITLGTSILMKCLGKSSLFKLSR